MFIEIKKIRQNRNEGYRRWFTSDDMDLFVWYDDKCRVSSFQISSRDGAGEYLVNWSENNGLTYSRVIEPEPGALRYKGSNLLVTRKRFKLKSIFDKFLTYSKKVNTELVRFIVNTLVREEILNNR